jgi:hypothetical protein
MTRMAAQVHPDASPERSRFDEQRDGDEGNDDQGAAGDEHVAEMVSGRASPHGLLVDFGYDRPFVDLSDCRLNSTVGDWFQSPRDDARSLGIKFGLRGPWFATAAGAREPEASNARLASDDC